MILLRVFLYINWKIYHSIYFNLTYELRRIIAIVQFLLFSGYIKELAIYLKNSKYERAFCDFLILI